MIKFNCTVKDLFRRPNMIDKTVRMLADNGYASHSATYALIRENIYNALAYLCDKMKPHEYLVASRYFGSRMTEQAIAEDMFYTLRTIRRYISRACELVRKYYADYWGIQLLPNDTRDVKCVVSPGAFWEKVDSMMNGSIEYACVAILYFHEHEAINNICSSFGVGNDKVKRISTFFNSIVTVIDLPEEKCSAV